jgi:hypothetical protein
LLRSNASMQRSNATERACDVTSRLVMTLYQRVYTSHRHGNALLQCGNTKQQACAFTYQRRNATLQHGDR